MYKSQHCCCAPVSVEAYKLSNSTNCEVAKQDNVLIGWMCCPVQTLHKLNNLCHYIDDFSVLAFFATSHGKTAGDGAAGTFKKLATKSSLQWPYTEQIISLRALYNFACTTIKGINFTFATVEQRNEELLLRERFSASSGNSEASLLSTYIKQCCGGEMVL